jgi:CDP-diacylglycerol--serine O-phosphatidyltransferase
MTQEEPEQRAEAPRKRSFGRRRRRRRRDRRAVYLLPNLFTTTSLLFGFWAIVEAANGEWSLSALGIVLAGVCDMLDGRIARATHSTSRFGLEYDSIADAVSFGVAPAFLVYSWALAPLGKRGWAVAALFAVCAALRLARFNVQAEKEERNRYQGLPSTIAGGFVALSIWYFEWAGLVPPLSRATGLMVTVGFTALALLMVSSVPYPGLKGIRLTSQHGIPVLVAAAIAWVVIFLHHEPVLFGLGVLYLLSGPALWLVESRGAGRRARARARAGQQPQGKESSGDVR